MDWQKLLDDYNIPYITRGPNTKRGEISIRCPWCGDEDPSEHLGISLNAPLWGCYRNGEHRGKNPIRLLKALLGCSTGQAQLTLAQYDATDPETFEQALALLTGEAPMKAIAEEKLVMPEEFKRISKPPITNPRYRFWQYLKDRGFSDPALLTRHYDLRCCSVGKWKDRIIIPIYDADGELVAWTGRSIQKSHKAPRYLSTEGDVIKTMLYNEHKLKSYGDVLFVTEGPFDALKMDYYLPDTTIGKYAGLDADYTMRNIAFRATATCTFGTSLTVGQLGKLRAYARNFKLVVILFDKDATAQSLQLIDMIPGAQYRSIPGNFQDPGELTPYEVRSLLYGHNWIPIP